MKNKRFSTRQIAAILRQGAAGAPVAALCRRHGISASRYYRWKRMSGAMPAPRAECERLRAENDRLRRLFAELAKDTSMLREVLRERAT